MTYKNGLIIGLITGFVAWLIIKGYLTFMPAPYAVAQMIRLIAVWLFVAAILLLIGSGFKRGSVVNPSVDGFIYGFIGSFELLYILNEFAAGRLPLPI